jgi:hypothetical protein
MFILNHVKAALVNKLKALSVPTMELKIDSHE